ncbi:class I SAM-dependent methyltransferase [Streptomyces sp. ISL-96]|uniref:class I SAM-dependent methyltransferase n=1 Tax=Streptomyces sp. ISL-96 TaxID=2819191 RepID=UPI0027E23878|nr:class I SAM-dependent methyltransferase [Streptomyces sp. ISL-96]
MRVLDVSSDAYRRAFELFLSGTDEKAVTHARLADLVAGLERRRVFLDVGAGAGQTTAHLGRRFDRTVAVEPSAAMRERLVQACPGAVVVAQPIESADGDGADLRDTADLALLSHVLYYLPEEAWLPTLRRVLGWVAPGGTLLVVLQSPGNACMRMVEHFTGTRFDMRPFARQLGELTAQVSGWSIETLDVRYRTTRFAEAVDVAEFMVNVPVLPSLDPLPARADLVAYVEKHFARPDGTYVIGHAHDILCVRRTPDPAAY